MVRLILCAAAIGTAAVAEERLPLREFLPQSTAACGAPADWVARVGKDEVWLKPPPDADFEKVDCILKRLNGWSGLKLGFVGNEADPNQLMPEPWSYIAEGKVSDLLRLSDQAQAAGWSINKLAKAEDGTGFLLFQSPSGVTVAEAEKFANRLWKHEFGDIKFGRPPDKNGSSFDEP